MTTDIPADRKDISAALPDTPLPDADLYGVSRFIKGRNEPVLIPRKARSVRRFLHRIAAHAPEIFGDLLRTRRLVIEVFPVDEFSLAVVGKRQPKVVTLRKSIDRVAFRRG